MEEKKGYNILKLVMHGNRCYVSTDYVRGKPMIQWLKYHPNIPKERLFNWTLEVLHSLEYFHQCQGVTAYQYVNPYSMIVSEDQKIYLLDLSSKDHEELIRLMQRKMVREHFLSPDNQFYQKANVSEDIYGFGKTLQYLIASVELTPSLSKREERKIRKIISKCLNQKSKKSYKTIREISLHFPKLKEKKKNEKRKYALKKIAYLLVLFLLVCMNVYLITQLNKKKVEVAKIQNKPKIIETKVEVIEKKLEGETREALLELALIYMLDYEEYEKSREILGMLEDDPFAKDCLQFIDYLQSFNLSDEQLEELITQIGENAEGSVFWKEKKYEQLFRLQIIQKMCSDSTVERQICADTIKKSLEKTPELVESQEFRQLQQDYEIIIEEGNVSVGK